MAVSEWDQRQLCADGGCIGVISSEGTCKVCGRAAPNWGDERMRGLIAPSQDPGDAEDDGDDDDADYDGEDGDGAGDEAGDSEREDKVPHAAVSAGGPTWTARALCPDGSCIGVIGPDGRCKVCRRPATVASPSPAAEAAAAASTPAAPAAPAAPEATTPPQSGAPDDAVSAAADRERCADPTCSGLIGADGRCAVCGKGAS